MALKPLFLFISSVFVNVSLVFSQPLTESIQKLNESSGMESASVSIAIYDVATKKELASLNKDKILAPASTTKLFSTAYALEHLGGAFKPSTKIYYSGQIKDSVLLGDVWIVGMGDMSLGSKHFSGAQRSAFLADWAIKIKELGIKEINGNIIGDGTSFGSEAGPSDWLWGDMGNYYGAHFSGLMLYDNILEFYFKTKSSGSSVELVRTFPVVENLNFKNHITASTKGGDQSTIYGAPYSLDREGRGELPQHQAEFRVRGSLPDPEGQLATELKNTLNSNGVNVKGKSLNAIYYKAERPTNSWIEILEYKGASVNELVKVTNFESVNVFAEGLMRLAAFQKFNISTHDAAVSNMESFWKQKLNAKNLYLNDGSGLSRTNAISAQTMCDLLLYMNSSSNQADFYSSLPVAGKSGTLKAVGNGQISEGKVHAKSGTMRRTKSYAGYVETNSGKRLAFAIIINNYTCSNKEVVSYMVQLMNAMVKQ